jgi:purine-nucleoside phosphorylase
MSPPADFLAAARRLAPATAVVLGSGLGPVVDRITAAAAVPFGELPGFAAPTVHGHSGRAVIGTWDGVAVLAFQGRTHFYEGNPWERVTAAVRLAADLGVRRVVLTNAAGGLRDDLNPGDLMAVRGHVELLDPRDWRRLVGGGDPSPQPPPRSGGGEPDGERVFAPSPLRGGGWERGHFTSPYTPALVARLESLGLPSGVYAGLTGPCYETPAEIRALRVMGADAVGMSTVKEAEAAAGLGLEVAAISCITNKAAGLASGTLSHGEVQEVASRADVVGRLANLLRALAVEW